MNDLSSRSRAGILVVLLFFATLLPISWGYLFSLIAFIWLVVQKKWRSDIIIPIKNNQTSVGLGELSAPLSYLFRPLFVGVAVHLSLVVFSSMMTSIVNGVSVLSELDELSHFLLKHGLLLVTVASFLIAVSELGIRLTQFARTIGIYLCLYLFYLLIQRYTGIDLSHGITATLPENRLAYGVYRLSGFISHPLTLSNNLVLLSIWAVFFTQLYWRTSAIPRITLILFNVILITSLFLTGSRGPILVLLLTMGAMELQLLWRKPWIVVIGSLGLGLGLYLEGSIVSRFMELAQSGLNIDRFKFWKVHFQIFLDHPFFGVGLSQIETLRTGYYQNMGIHDKMYSAHNIFLQYLAQSGVAGLLGLLGLFWGLTSSALRVRRITRNRGVLALVLATFLTGFMQNNLTDSENIFTLWVTACLLMVHASSKRLDLDRAGSSI